MKVGKVVLLGTLALACLWAMAEGLVFPESLLLALGVTQLVALLLVLEKLDS